MSSLIWLMSVVCGAGAGAPSVEEGEEASGWRSMQVSLAYRVRTRYRVPHGAGIVRVRQDTHSDSLSFLEDHTNNFGQLYLLLQCPSRRWGELQRRLLREVAYRELHRDYSAELQFPRAGAAAAAAVEDRTPPLPLDTQT